MNQVGKKSLLRGKTITMYSKTGNVALGRRDSLSVGGLWAPELVATALGDASLASTLVPIF